MEWQYTKPSAIRVELSNDNTDFNTVGELKFTFEEIFREGTFIDNCTIDLGGKEARYVRVTGKGARKVSRESRTSRTRIESLFR